MVYLFLADGFEECEAIGVLDVFRRAGVPLQTVGVTGKTVTSAHDLTVTADILLDEMPSSGWQMLVLPGGSKGVENLGQCEVLGVMLQKAFTLETPVAATCAAPTLLADLRLIDGYNVTCYPALAEQVKAGGAVPHPEKPWVIDRHLVTGRGVGACLSFGLAALSLIRGDEIAEKTAETVQTPRWKD